MNAIENSSVRDLGSRDLSSLRAHAADDRPLDAVLDEVCRLAETLLPGARCSVLLRDHKTETLRHGVAPSLPEEFRAAIDGLPVAVGSGACGTAVASGQPVLLEDVLTHPFTVGFVGLARAHSLRACWSLPLSTVTGVVGAFAAYYAAPRLPTQDELTRTQSCARLAALVLEQHEARKERTRALQETAAELKAEMARREAAMVALAHSQKVEALGQLTGGVAHDFNNLLSAIMGGFELIETRAGDEDVLRLARNGLRACERAAALVRQLLAIARRDPPALTQLDIANALPQWRGLIGHALQPGIEFTVKLAPEIWPVLVDPPQLETALLNLALNARDAMPGGGRLTITVENCPAGAMRGTALLARDFVLIKVADSGRGMAPDIVQRIFEPFFTTKRRGEGTGLGLAMVHTFVCNAGGEIFVDSAPGAGTVFSLYLPRAGRTPPQGDIPARLRDVRKPGARILMVDDDDDVRGVASSFLHDAGYHVVEAAGGQEALESLRSAPADLVVTDLAMPGMDGMALARQIRASWPAIPVMFVTGYAEEYDLTGERMLQKPFGATVLLDAVAQAMA